MPRYKRGEDYPIRDLMRLLAKSKAGKIEWSIYKSIEVNTNMFSSNYNDWSLAQKFFVYWSSFYASVGESFERPPERVIQDDELLEVWLKRQDEQFKERAEENWTKTGTLHDIKSAYDHEEIILFGEE